MAKTAKKSWTKKRIIFWALLGIIALPLLAMLSYHVYLYFNPQLRVDFQTFKPSYLPQGMSVQSEELEVRLPHQLLWFAPSSVGIDFVLNGGYISQTKAEQPQIPLCKYVDFDKKCTMHKSQKFEYAQYLDYDATYRSDTKETIYGEFREQSIVFYRDNTSIEIRFNRKGKDPISDQEIAKMVDSFEPATLTNLTVKRRYPGP